MTTALLFFLGVLLGPLSGYALCRALYYRRVARFFDHLRRSCERLPMGDDRLDGFLDHHNRMMEAWRATMWGS